MTDQIILTIPENITVRAREIAQSKSQPIERVLLDYLETLPESLLESDEQNELHLLNQLSDDILWTIAGAQMLDDVQKRAHELMERNSQGALSEQEQSELEKLVDRADRLMIRKAEASAILKKRGLPFTQKDFKPKHE